jgi:hypothetical protein
VPPTSANPEQPATDKLLAFYLLASAALPAQQIPAPTRLFGQPIFIEQTRIVGGAGATGTT